MIYTIDEIRIRLIYARDFTPHKIAYYEELLNQALKNQQPMKKIKAKFASTCADTGARIKKGDDMYYDYTSKKCYCMQSGTAREHDIINSGEQVDAAAGMIQANEEAYFDNFCQRNNI